MATASTDLNDPDSKLLDKDPSSLRDIVGQRIGCLDGQPGNVEPNGSRVDLWRLGHADQAHQETANGDL